MSTNASCHDQRSSSAIARLTARRPAGDRGRRPDLRLHRIRQRPEVNPESPQGTLESEFRKAKSGSRSTCASSKKAGGKRCA